MEKEKHKTKTNSPITTINICDVGYMYIVYIYK